MTVQRSGQQPQSSAAAFAGRRPDPAILPGDLLHVDFGISYLGLNTDTQHHGYVLRPGETDAPPGLKVGLAAVNRVTERSKLHCKRRRSLCAVAALPAAAVL